ncbi:MAG: FdtA/QdtA family cupin domain-containing protein [Fibromonadaceae bacterium]|jgi:dTDP-4-dehydrorhamnose 3,5-epimerase-like enzyme|nr:FdtA/QdtA family cupin domain-containing protein [Fibromonadaceae bacterium]
MAKLINIPVVHDKRGNLSVIEGNRNIPFNIKRVYYLYDVPGGAKRGGHAHRKLKQLIIAASGSFDVVLHNGKEKETFTLNRSNVGLYVPQMTWREIENFSSGAVCLVLASKHYDESDYIRNFKEFKKLTES